MCYLYIIWRKVLFSFFDHVKLYFHCTVYYTHQSKIVIISAKIWDSQKNKLKTFVCAVYWRREAPTRHCTHIKASNRNALEDTERSETDSHSSIRQRPSLRLSADRTKRWVFLPHFRYSASLSTLSDLLVLVHAWNLALISNLQCLDPFRVAWFLLVFRSLSFFLLWTFLFQQSVPFSGSSLLFVASIGKCSTCFFIWLFWACFELVLVAEKMYDKKTRQKSGMFGERASI